MQCRDRSVADGLLRRSEAAASRIQKGFRTKRQQRRQSYATVMKELQDTVSVRTETDEESMFDEDYEEEEDSNWITLLFLATFGLSSIIAKFFMCCFGRGGDEDLGGGGLMNDQQGQQGLQATPADGIGQQTTTGFNQATTGHQTAATTPNGLELGGQQPLAPNGGGQAVGSGAQPP